MFILDVAAFFFITVMKISRVLISMLRYILHYFMAVMKKILGLLILCQGGLKYRTMFNISSS